MREVFFFARSVSKKNGSRMEERIIETLQTVNQNLILLNERMENHDRLERDTAEKVSEVHFTIHRNRKRL